MAASLPNSLDEEEKKTPSRDQVPESDRWNVEAFFPNFAAWQADFKKWAREENKENHWPEIRAFKGKIKEGPDALAALLKVYLEIDRALTKLYTYAHLRHDEDVANDDYKQAHTRATSILFDFKSETSWIEPELLELSDSKIQEYLNSALLKEYKIYLEKIVRMKPHTLSAEKEELIALAGNALETPSRTFGSFNNADLKFPDVEDSTGKKMELTHGKFLLYLRSKDRKLRKEAFVGVHKSFLAYENTLADLISGEMQKHLFNARSRKYKSCLEAALFPHQIDPSVYFSLVQSVRNNIGPLHRYMSVRKKLLKVDELHLYDMHIPLVSEVSFSIPYSEAVDQIVRSVEPLGKEYQKDLEKGFKGDRWVDKYENLRKRSGAYSSGCYDSMPYILMNYQGSFNDLMTLAHEAGHSMQTFLSSRHQSYQDSSYPIFVAEVASTFNEELLSRDLLSRTKDKKTRAFLINQKIDDIRATLFRQTMFAEFELKLHTWVEEGVPLTPSLLKTEYRKLNAFYFGKDVTLDEEIDIEWSRIPHFYYNYYVYQYATGISAALALCEKVIKEGESARKKYLAFLSSGGSKYPLELLELAGVDMRKPDAVIASIRHFDSLVSELEALLS